MVVNVEWRDDEGDALPRRAVDRELGISIRLIRARRPATPEQEAAAWLALRRVLKAREEARALVAYHANLTPAGLEVLRQLRISAA
jgi:hypothetical protein